MFYLIMLNKQAKIGNNHGNLEIHSTYNGELLNKLDSH